ncbi:oligopeptide/dipeptide ABC transporter ATP-binding protein [Mesorhizobium robiniae]|uniref:Oligopeptide/dipeptide ABC transporter ATP-binding protein n=1 Tax=Mesorhizobium robiniae TaxID=559315 RepID=A0ABV2GIP2_9HYPH
MILSVRDLAIGFRRPGGELNAVDRISFDVEQGETFVIIGESGSGKSLTGMSIAGLQPQTSFVSGSIRFKDRELLNRPDAELRKTRGREIGLIYQDPLGSLNPVWPIGNQIAEALTAHGLANRADAAKRAVEMLDRVRIPDPVRVASAYPHEISGGMRQRAMIAMALAAGPSLLIADEPTTALDVTIKAQMLELLAELKREMDLTIILITHDMGVVAEVANRILVMYAGRIAEIGPADSIMRRPAHPYTAALMASAMISETTPKHDLNAIVGVAPGLGAFPSACRFHPRCPMVQDGCRTTEPPKRPFGGVQLACHHPIASADAASLVGA